MIYKEVTVTCISFGDAIIRILSTIPSANLSCFAGQYANLMEMHNPRNRSLM